MDSNSFELILKCWLESRVSVQYSSIPKTARLYRSLQETETPTTALESVIKDVTAKETQHQLLWLGHTWSCKKKAFCSLLHCKLTYEAIHHLKNCSSGYNCPFPLCSSSQKAITHWKQCTHSDCYICVSYEIFKAANRNELSAVNALKLIFSVLGYRIIKDCGQEKVDDLEQVVEILKVRIINERKIICDCSELNEWLVIQNLFDYLKYEIPSDKWDIYLLLEVTIVSKNRSAFYDYSGDPYTETHLFKKFGDKEFKKLVKAFGLRIIKEQGRECEHSEIDILKKVFNDFQSGVKNDNYKAEIPYQFFNILQLTARYDETDCKIMKEILHSFGYTVSSSTAIKITDKSETDILEQACDIVNGNISDEEDEDESELLEPENMRLIIPFLAHCTIIPNSPTLSNVDAIRQVLDAFKERISTHEIDNRKFSQGKILKRVINALKYQYLYQNTKINAKSQRFMPFKDQLSAIYFVKSMLEQLGCIIIQEKVPNFKMPIIEIVEKTFDDLDWKIIRDEDRIENLPAIYISEPTQPGIIKLDPLDLMVHEIDQALNPSSFQNVALSEKIDITVIQAEKTKKWHRKLTTDFRNETLHRLVNVMFPKSDLDVRREELISKAKLVMFARQVEKDTYEEADSVNDYHSLLAETFSQYET